MARHVKSWIVAIVTLAIAGILGAWATIVSDEKVVDELLLEHSGDIEVRFKICSRDGEPLNRVRVKLAKSYLSNALSGEYNPDRFVVDSEFTVEERGVSAIHVSFSKDGFYGERWEYVLSERPPESWGRLHKIDVDISMTPQPVPAPLEKFEGALRADRDGPLSVLFPTKNRLPSGEPPNHVVSVPPKEDKSFPYLYLVADVQHDGRLASTLFPLKSFSVPKPVLRRGYLRITGSSDGDGFFPVDIGKVPPIFERGFRRLQQAPESHYSDSLELVPIEGNEKLFFYCRIGGRFGKGVVSNPAVVIEREGIETAISLTTIYLNPTGSRDVSYIHH